LNQEKRTMTHTYEELKHKTVVELREIAQGIEHEAVEGASQMNKDHLLKAMCTALGIEMHAHHHVVGIDKSVIKTRIQELKKKRDEVLASPDKSSLHGILRQIHSLKRQIRRATV
jgi:DNA-binding IclR family transcriptional regulator